MKGRGIPNESPKEYGELQVNMNLYYHAVNQDVKQIKPTSLAEGQVIIALHSSSRVFSSSSRVFSSSSRVFSLP